MKYIVILFVFGVLCQNILARGIGNTVLDDFERRLVRLESRQFSDSENLEHRMLQLEMQLGNQKGEEKPEISQIERNYYEISKVEKHDEEMTFLQRLEKVEKNWEKDLKEKLTEFSSKYENLSERLLDIEEHIEKQNDHQNNQDTESTSVEENSNSEEHKLQTIGSNSEENKFQTIGSKSYYIEDNRTVTWTTAVMKCRDMNAHLVSLQNEDEWNALRENLNQEHSYWTDINDRAEENEFVSETTDRRAPFLQWDENEPNSSPGAEDCVELRSDHDFRMNDVYCLEFKYFICEKRNNDNYETTEE
ncbi:C-type lectin domain family 4 member G-like isoform X2 [Drosophila serrata]|uniref:C-type lectin domain family 4 member G-like isoform X2 n=1 Tax=Drosophila serrata TaxID=7274 RepID=UPI000A1D2471|nr:C-type lectin domain family 4 member G-like isoform X2 [Drosophila serrata]